MPSSSAVRPLDLREGQPVLDLFRVVRERHHQLRPVVELHQEELVLRIGGLEELGGRLARFLQLGPMLPLVSNTMPIESGASSLENCVIFCSTLSSNSLKCSFSSR